jgi:thiosulfate dehydrogenase (quinone) large subunit
MAKLAEPPGAAVTWNSDASIAYAILRLTFGVNIGLRGLTRLINGTDVLAADFLKQFQNPVIPVPGVETFAHVLPWVEAAIGLLLVTGFQTRTALIVGGLMMTALTGGTMAIQNFQTAWLQLTYALMFFILLVFRSWNLISVDALMGTRATSEPEATRVRA